MKIKTEFDIDENGKTIAVSTPEVNAGVLIPVFGRKVEKVCDTTGMRSVLNCVYFEDGFLICTDGHILLRQSLEKYRFSDDDIENINGKYIRAKTMTQIRSFDLMEILEDCIRCYTADLKTIADFPYYVPERSYPDYKAILRSPEEVGEVYNIGLSMKTIAVVKDIMLCTTGRAELYFAGRERGILVKSQDYTWHEEIILIMPLVLEHKEEDQEEEGEEDDEIEFLKI